MAIFPRPVSPRSAAADLWSYLAQHRAHKWPLLGLSAAITWVIIWAFIVDANTNTTPRRNKIIYIENWSTNRSDIAIILQQKKELMQQEALLRQQQHRMQGFADAFGVEWRAEAKRNAERRALAIRQIEAQLDARLAKAEGKMSTGPDTKLPDARSATTTHKTP